MLKLNIKQILFIVILLFMSIALFSEIVYACPKANYTAKGKFLQKVIHKPPKKESSFYVVKSYASILEEKYGIPKELIISMAYQESRFHTTSRNGSCLGIMQVSTRWHAARAKRLGVKNFYDMYGSMLLGTDYYSAILKKYKDPALALMMYNMGPKRAMELYKQGIITNYAKDILQRAKLIKKGVWRPYETR